MTKIKHPSPLILFALMLVVSTILTWAPAWSRMPVYVPPMAPRHAHGSMHRRTRQVVQYSGSHRHVVSVKISSHRRRHGRQSRHARVVHHERHAYPLNFFMLNAPSFDRSPLDADQAQQVRQAFETGVADKYPGRFLVRAGMVNYFPLHGGIFWRREPVKYIILHSTETGIPQDARHVITSWGSTGRRHPGAQYVIDRDGTIWQAVDPDLATVHVNIFKTLPGINNDNSIGIEMCHAGRQDYPPEQRSAAMHLIAYLQGCYKVSNENVITHRYAQQGDHTDPVAFDFEAFISEKNNFRASAITQQLDQIANDSLSWNSEWPTASTFLQIHGNIMPSQTSTFSKNIEQLPGISRSTTGGLAVPHAELKPVSSSVAPVRTNQIQTSVPASYTSAPAVSGLRSGVQLRGPIEMDPASAAQIDHN